MRRFVYTIAILLVIAFTVLNFYSLDLEHKQFPVDGPYETIWNNHKRLFLIRNSTFIEIWYDQTTNTLNLYKVD